MADKFKNKYRIPSARLQSWDYGSNGAYFITLCAKNRIPYFGTIVQTTNLGVSDEFHNTNDLDHMDESYESLDSGHGEETLGSGFSTKLTKIGKMADKYWHEIPKHFPFIKLGAFVIMPEHIHGIIIIDKTPDHDNETPKFDVNSKKWKPETLGTILNQYKRIITINARKSEPKFAWVPRFHDKIIRDDRAFINITNYIINNPQKWADDNIENE